jgi:2-oxoisovalerate dehydrogenase E2 component (dihydrolipoyl transacylase)
MDAIALVRETLKPVALKHGVRLSLMPFMIKVRMLCLLHPSISPPHLQAASLALTEYPILNSSLSEDLTQLVFHASHDISLAMDTPQGLVVPTIKVICLWCDHRHPLISSVWGTGCTDQVDSADCA